MAAALSPVIAKHAGPAYSSKAGTKSGKEIGTVVPGIRACQSQTVMDVLTTDKNVAESLERVRGVSIAREFAGSERDGEPAVSSEVT